MSGLVVFFQPVPGYHHAFADGCDHQTVAVCITCFFQHSVDVGPHRGFGHIQFYGDLGIGFSLTEQAQSLHFSVGQLAGKRIAELDSRNAVRSKAFARKSAFDHAHKVTRR